MATRQSPSPVSAAFNSKPPAHAPRTASRRAGRAKGTAARAAAALSAVVALTLANAGLASAEPDLDTVQKKVRSLGEKVEKVTEKYRAAQSQLDSTKSRVKSLSTRAREQERKVERLRGDLSGLAAGTYMHGAARIASLTAAKSPQQLVDRATSLQQISMQDKERLEAFTSANKRLDAKRKAVAGAVKDRRGLAKKMKKQKKDITSSLSEQKALLARMTASNDSSSRGGDRPNPDLPPASGKVGAVIAFAQAQLGKPYQWGGDGPGAYDCSGLTMAAWQEGGVSLPHSSQSQQSSGPSVSRSQLQPGDLVFFGNPTHHVGLYVGSNKMIHAPNSGESVQYTSLNDSYYSSNYSGAVRPG